MMEQTGQQHQCAAFTDPLMPGDPGAYQPKSEAEKHPALLIQPLTNGHLMVSQVNRTDVRTLATLNRWYPNFIDALALVQKAISM